MEWNGPDTIAHQIHESIQLFMRTYCVLDVLGVRDVPLCARLCTFSNWNIFWVRNCIKYSHIKWMINDYFAILDHHIRHAPFSTFYFKLRICETIKVIKVFRRKATLSLSLSFSLDWNVYVRLPLELWSIRLGWTFFFFIIPFEDLERFSPISIKFVSSRIMFTITSFQSCQKKVDSQVFPSFFLRISEGILGI